jgi:hypothetical protein
VIDFTTNNAVLGIELLGFDADVLDAARAAFAAEHALAFPRDLAAAFAAHKWRTCYAARDRNTTIDSGYRMNIAKRNNGSDTVRIEQGRKIPSASTERRCSSGFMRRGAQQHQSWSHRMSIRVPPKASWALPEQRTAVAHIDARLEAGTAGNSQGHRMCHRAEYWPQSRKQASEEKSGPIRVFPTRRVGWAVESDGLEMRLQAVPAHPRP